MDKTDLLAVGDYFQDLIFHGLSHVPELGEELYAKGFVRTHGGGATITAVAAARLGTKTAIASALDEAAQAMLREHGVAFHNVLKPGEPTAITCAISTSKDRAFVSYDPFAGALHTRLRQTAPQWNANWVHFGLCPEHCSDWLPVIEHLQSQGSKTSFDVGWNPRLLADPHWPALQAKVDLLFINEKECALFSGLEFGPEAEAFWKSRTKATVIKRGTHGAVCLSGKHRAEAPGVTCEVMDTTGAGDAFNGGFIHAMLRGLPVAECLTIANRVGACSTRKPGGIDGLPTQQELQNLEVKVP